MPTRIRAADAHICQPLGLPSPTSQILPIILGDDKRTMAVAAECQRAGFDMRGVRPPTVPAGTSRLRLSLTLNATETDIVALAETLVLHIGLGKDAA